MISKHTNKVKDLENLIISTGSDACKDIYMPIIYDEVTSAEKIFSLSAHIYFSEERVQEIANEARRISTKKVELGENTDDSASMSKRFFTGSLAEFALEEWLELKRYSIFNPEVGESFKYKDPDFTRLGITTIGVKAANPPYFPICNPLGKADEVICIVRHNGFDVDVYICGLATVVDLRENTSMALIGDPNIIKKGIKKAFFGFDLLTPIPKGAEGLKLLMDREAENVKNRKSSSED